MELYLPPSYAKIPRQSEWYKTTDTFKRRSEASKIKARKYWGDKRHRRRIDKKQAKPVDVFDLEGRFIASYPSARKAAEALAPYRPRPTAERCIRRCRKGDLKSYLGYMFRDHVKGATDIERYSIKPKKKGYKCREGIKKPKLQKPCAEVCEFGILNEWPSLQECAKDIGCSYSGLWLAMKDNRKIKGRMVVLKSTLITNL